jgi:hypothetical protein
MLKVLLRGENDGHFRVWNDEKLNASTEKNVCGAWREYWSNEARILQSGCVAPIEESHSELNRLQNELVPQKYIRSASEC